MMKVLRCFQNYYYSETFSNIDLTLSTKSVEDMCLDLCVCVCVIFKTYRRLMTLKVSQILHIKWVNPKSKKCITKL